MLVCVSSSVTCLMLVDSLAVFLCRRNNTRGYGRGFLNNKSIEWGRTIDGARLLQESSFLAVCGRIRREEQRDEESESIDQEHANITS